MKNKNYNSLMEKFKISLAEKCASRALVDNLPSEYLLKCFKFYDLKNTGKCEFREFWKVVKIKVGV